MGTKNSNNKVTPVRIANILLHDTPACVRRCRCMFTGTATSTVNCISRIRLVARNWEFHRLRTEAHELKCKVPMTKPMRRSDHRPSNIAMAQYHHGLGEWRDQCQKNLVRKLTIQYPVKTLLKLERFPTTESHTALLRVLSTISPDMKLGTKILWGDSVLF